MVEARIAQWLSLIPEDADIKAFGVFAVVGEDGRMIAGYEGYNEAILRSLDDMRTNVLGRNLYADAI